MGAVNTARKRKELSFGQQIMKILNRTLDRTFTSYPKLRKKYSKERLKWKEWNRDHKNPKIPSQQ